MNVRVVWTHRKDKQLYVCIECLEGDSELIPGSMRSKIMLPAASLSRASTAALPGSLDTGKSRANLCPRAPLPSSRASLPPPGEENAERIVLRASAKSNQSHSFQRGRRASAEHWLPWFSDWDCPLPVPQGLSSLRRDEADWDMLNQELVRRGSVPSFSVGQSLPKQRRGSSLGSGSHGRRTWEGM